MFKFLFIFLLSILAFKLIRANRDPHLCTEAIEVPYTEEVLTPLHEYGPFAEYFKKMNMTGSRKNVTKTRTELREYCCPGYIMSPDSNGDCQPLLTTIKPNTTTSNTRTHLTDATDTSTDSNPWNDDSSTELKTSTSTTTAETSWDEDSSMQFETSTTTTTEETPKEKPVESDCKKYALYLILGILLNVFVLLFLVCYTCKKQQKKYRVQQDIHRV